MLYQIYKKKIAYFENNRKKINSKFFLKVSHTTEMIL